MCLAQHRRTTCVLCCLSVWHDSRCCRRAPVDAAAAAAVYFCDDRKTDWPLRAVSARRLTLRCLYRFCMCLGGVRALTNTCVPPSAAVNWNLDHDDDADDADNEHL
jgi:hypothetical protein